VANNDVFFSHRKEQGITGRMLAVIGFHSGEKKNHRIKSYG
jgi:copper oxidase (laccase) domain-containing protein